MGEEESNGSFVDTWLDSPYIYDIYDTNDGDSMTVMTQVSIPMLNGILILQIRIYGKLNVFVWIIRLIYL